MAIPKESANVVFTAKEKAELRREPLQPPGQGEVLVRSTWTLISTGTETICYGRRFDPGTAWEGWVTYPFHPGYSQVGVVEAVGPGVERLQVGDHVASIHDHRQFISAPEKTFFRILDGVADRDAAWMTVSYIVQNGVRRAEHQLGEDIAIIGLGPLGQMAVQYTRLLGARVIITIDPMSARQEMAKAHGATHTLAMGVDQALEKATEITHGRLCDSVYDITGNDKVFAGAQQLLRKLGKLVLIGDTGSPSGQHLTSAIIGKSLTLVATHASVVPPQDTEWSHWTRQNMAELFFQYLKDGRMRVSDLNTHAFSPQDAQAAYQKLLHDRANTMGTHFDWTRIS